MFYSEHMYSTNAEYRSEIRKFFNMDFSQAVLDPQIDEISQDEQLYDEIASKIATDKIFERTKDNPLFQRVYDICAAKFFSTDREIGMVVLCSYDFFWYFKQALEDYDKNPTEFSETSETYQALLRAI